MLRVQCALTQARYSNAGNNLGEAATNAFVGYVVARFHLAVGAPYSAGCAGRSLACRRQFATLTSGAAVAFVYWCLGGVVWFRASLNGWR